MLVKISTEMLLDPDVNLETCSEYFVTLIGIPKSKFGPLLAVTNISVLKPNKGYPTFSRLPWQNSYLSQINVKSFSNC